MLMSDNSTVVPYVKNQGGTRSRPLCRLSVDVLQLCAALDVLLGVRDFPGRLNLVADGLSRTQLPPTEWSLHPQVFQRILRLFQACSWDLFATRYNNQLLNFFSPFTDPLAAGMDALSLDWADRDLDAFPPFPLIPKVLQRLERFQCQLTLIAPLRWNRSWISPLSPGVSQSRGSFPCVRTCFSSLLGGSTPGSTRSEPSCLQTVRRELRRRKFSTPAVERIINSRRPSTLEVYDTNGRYSNVGATRTVSVRWNWNPTS